MNSLRCILVSAILFPIARIQAGPIMGEEVEHSYPVDPQSRISVSNGDGAIWIYGGAVDEITVHALKRAFSSEQLKKITVDVSIEPGEVTINTRLPERPAWGLGDRSGTVDLVVVLPWQSRELQVALTTGEILLEGLWPGSVRAKLGDGRLFVRNCFGNVRVEVGNGGIDAQWKWWEPDNFSFHAQIVNGNSYIYLPSAAACRLRVASVTGKVATDLVRLEENNQEKNSRKIDTHIGGPSEAEVNVNATNGNVLVTGER